MLALVVVHLSRHQELLMMIRVFRGVVLVVEQCLLRATEEEPSLSIVVGQLILGAVLRRLREFGRRQQVADERFRQVVTMLLELGIDALCVLFKRMWRVLLLFKLSVIICDLAR